MALRESCCCNKYLKIWTLLWNWVMRRGLESFEVQARRSLNCHKSSIKGDAGEGSEMKEEHYREALLLLKGYLSDHKQNIGRNMDHKKY